MPSPINMGDVIEPITDSMVKERPQEGTVEQLEVIVKTITELSILN
ncbi:MAG: hypothetical protein ACQEWV_08195 [Bacillota bacterium]